MLFVIQIENLYPRRLLSDGQMIRQLFVYFIRS